MMPATIIALLVLGTVCVISTGHNINLWKQADLTYYESYPDPNSTECVVYNGCKWEGLFAFLVGKQPKEWVRANNIIALHSKYAHKYRLKTLRIKQGTHQIDATVYDYCADTDCKGCCTDNSNKTGFLIDMEKHTMERFGSGSGVVEWYCLNC